MQLRTRASALALLTAGLLSTTVLSGCFVHHHHDYVEGGYAWSTSEEPYYEQWEHETHRDHKDWNQRSQDEQQQYWQWRQSHGGGHGDHDNH